MGVFAAARARQGLAAPVVDSSVARVLALPVCGVSQYDVCKITHDGHELSGWVLRLEQLRALHAIESCGGAVLPMGVGHGKTIVSLLAGAVLGVDLAIVLVSPATMAQTEAELERLSRYFKLPKTMLVSWGALSQTSFAGLPTSPGKTVLVADEAHNARYATSARTKRLHRYLTDNAACHFVALSGTLVTNSLSDYAHLVYWALRGRSPLPEGEAFRAWERTLLDEGEPGDDQYVKPLLDWAGPVPEYAHTDTVGDARLAFRQRFTTCPGVVATTGQSCSASLYIARFSEKALKDSPFVRLADKIAATFRDLDGNDLASKNDVAACAKKLALGYWYKWHWPGEPDREWLEARNGWHRSVRWLLEQHSKDGCDSPKLIERLVENEPDYFGPLHMQAYNRWEGVRDRVAPTPVAVWESLEPLKAICRKAAEVGECLVWYDEQAVADQLAREGLRVVRPGEAPHWQGTQALSLRSHGSGLNLQHYSQNVFACVPSSPTRWEQVLGRTHRQGQKNDEVWAWVPGWSWPLRAPLDKARSKASFVAATSGEQKLQLATFI